MKKFILLLIVPLLFFNSCEEEEVNDLTYSCNNGDCFAVEGGQYATLNDCLSVCNDNNNSSIIGTWVDYIQGGWVITGVSPNTSSTYIELENPNYSLVPPPINNNQNDDSDIFGDCACQSTLGSTQSTNDNGFNSWVYGTWDYSTNELIPNNSEDCATQWCSGINGYIGYENDFNDLTFLGMGTEYHEKLTFFEDGTYSYQVSPTIWKKECGDLYGEGFVGDTFEQIPIQPFITCSTGTYSLAENVITINSETFALQLDGNNLTLDRSHVGNEELITNWVKQ